MRRTLVELERLMLPQTSEAARAHMQTKQKTSGSHSVELLDSEIPSCDSCAVIDAILVLGLMMMMHDDDDGDDDDDDDNDDDEHGNNGYDDDDTVVCCGGLLAQWLLLCLL